MKAVTTNTSAATKTVKKHLRDTTYMEVAAHQYKRLKCNRTFRVYPHDGRFNLAASERIDGDAVLARVEVMEQFR